MKRIPSFQGYFATENGEIIGKRGKPLSPYKNECGYKVVSVYKNDRSYTRSVHRLVAEAFLGKKGPGLVVRHLNGNKVDNRACNLSYGTYKENEDDKIRHGTICTGDKNHNTKISEKDVEDIRSSYVFRCRVNGGVAMAKRYGVSKSTITRIAKRQWRTK